MPASDERGGRRAVTRLLTRRGLMAAGASVWLGAVAGLLGRGSGASAAGEKAVVAGGSTQTRRVTRLTDTRGDGLLVVTKAASGSALSGLATSPGEVASVGVFGASVSDRGVGVRGHASAPGGATRGVSGESDSPDGVGVHGEARATTGVSAGVYGVSQGSGGAAGVYGYSAATAGSGRGVYGRTDSPSGWGVGAFAGAWTGYTYGVNAEVLSTDGTAVYGTSTAISGRTVGVLGQAASPEGVAVRGWATAESGRAVGVQGASNSKDGIGVDGSASGIGGRFHSDAGRALVVDVDSPDQVGVETTGRIVFRGRSGRIGVAAGTSSVSVEVPGGLLGEPICFATVIAQSPEVSVLAATPGADGTLAIHLSGAPTKPCLVGWLVLG